jgi:hypothetical protein
MFGAFALLGLLHGEGIGLKSDIAQSLRDQAWKHALAGQPDHQPWPWEDAAPPSSRSVPRLGLSAAVLIGADWPAKSAMHRLRAPARAVTPDDGRDPHIDLGDISVGDDITVKGADGKSRVYRVTRRRIVDPGQAVDANVPANADPHLQNCEPHGSSMADTLRLIIDAVRPEPKATTAPSPEQL